MKAKVAVVGFGSIGKRHTQYLEQLDCDVAVVSSQELQRPNVFKKLEGCLVSHKPIYVVIANNTSDHLETLQTLLKFSYKGKILIEKPLFKDYVELKPLNEQQCNVAYNLRFHPLLQKLKEILTNQKVIQVQIYVGKYLPGWRSQGRIGYSGDKLLGGGVLRDLSHEIDYTSWLFGSWTSVAAIGGHYSHLPITSDDVFSILGTTLNAPVVSLQMNYLDHIGKREIFIQCDSKTIYCDLLNPKLTVNDTVETFEVSPQDTYLLQHRAMLSGNTDTLCSYREGLDVMKVIAAAEESAQQKKWVQISK